MGLELDSELKKICLAFFYFIKTLVKIFQNIRVFGIETNRNFFH